MHHADGNAEPQKHKRIKQITVTVEPDDCAAFDRLARQGDVTVSWLIRRSMREFLERQERRFLNSSHRTGTPCRRRCLHMIDLRTNQPLPEAASQGTRAIEGLVEGIFASGVVQS